MTNCEVFVKKQFYFSSLCVLRAKKDVSLHQNLNPDIHFSANSVSSLCTPCEKKRDSISP